MASKITITKGTTHTIVVTYRENGEVTDISGSTVFFTVKPEEWDTDADDSDATLKKTVTSHSDAANGESTISLTPTDTDLTPGKYFYDVKIKLASGEIHKLDEGRLVIDGSPTNRQS